MKTPEYSVITDTEYSCGDYRREHLECVCTDPSHTAVVELALSDRDTLEDPEIRLSIQLTPFLPWYKRVYEAVRYVFGINRTMWGGHWDVCILDKSSIEKLHSMVTAYTIVRKMRAALRKKRGVKHYR